MDHIWQALLTEKEKAYLKSLDRPPSSFCASSGMMLVGTSVDLRAFNITFFSQVLNKFPSKYKQDRGALRWFVPPMVRQDLILMQECRSPGGSDKCLDFDWREKMCRFGVPIVDVPGFSVGVLTYHDNFPEVKNPEALVVGFFANSD